MKFGIRIAAALQLYNGEHEVYPPAANWETDLTTGRYIRSVPRSPIDGVAYVYAADAGRSNFVLSDGPDKYLRAGVSGYIVYTPAGGLEVGVASVPSP